jgi:gamma-glutamyltranspeptidase/glutathione hydrolase
MNRKWESPYQSRRLPVMARNVVATSQPLAAQAGLEMLRRGGNAVDAALAAAITLTVVEPTSNGIGSDAFALIWDGSKLHGINGSGRSPAAWTPERFKGLEEMVQRGWDSVTVPGAVSLWTALAERFGRLDFATLFEPGIRYAEQGFAVSPITAARWAEAAKTLYHFDDFRAAFLPGGRPPEPGEIFVCPAQGETLREIASSGGESFYRGALAQQIVACSRRQGGLLSLDDLAGQRALWVEPVSVAYREHQVFEMPPNTQGIAVLQCLKILEQFDLSRYPVDSAESVHLQVEAMKLAFGDLFAHLADPEAMQVDYQRLLEPRYLAERATLIDMERASYPLSGLPAEPGTVYLTTADSSSMMVSLIQSNYRGFGSGVVVPGTGISLQNRGSGFSLEAGHANQVAGGKRPFHTIIPGFIARDGKALLSFGVMGAHMQAQGQVQIVTRILDYGQNPQAASDAPRWHVAPDGELALEAGFAPEVIAALQKRGHRVVLDEPQSLFGGAQLIQCLDGCYAGASDHRKDGQAVGF